MCSINLFRRVFCFRVLFLKHIRSSCCEIKTNATPILFNQTSNSMKRTKLQDCRFFAECNTIASEIGEGKRRKEFAEWYVEWRAEWHNYVKYDLRGE